jgi:hypothetical protein
MTEEIRNGNLARMDLLIMHLCGKEVIRDHTGNLLRVVVGVSDGRENPQITVVHHRIRVFGNGLEGASQDRARASRGRLFRRDSGMAFHFWIGPESRRIRKQSTRACRRPNRRCSPCRATGRLCPICGLCFHWAGDGGQPAHSTPSRFHSPDLAGTRPGPLCFNDARVPGAHDAGNNACRICWKM